MLDKNQQVFSASEVKVLVVDDNSMNLKVISKILKKSEIQVSEAASGLECLEMAASEQFDLIFMDHMMPEMDGIETFRRLREMDSSNKMTPVIALTANTDENAQVMYRAEGFADYVLKPVKPDVLNEIIGRHLGLGVSSSNVISRPTSSDTPISLDSYPDKYPEIKGIDWQLAESHFTDADTMMDTLRNFFITLRTEAEKINALYLDSDTEQGLLQYKIHVHSMKSSAALVGIAALAAKAQALENAAAAGDVEYIHMSHAEFVDEWTGFYDRLKDIFDADKVTVDFDREAFIVHLKKLDEAAQMLDVDVMDSEARKLAEYNIPWSDEIPKMEKLQAAIVNLDNLTISEIVVELIARADAD